VRDVEQSLNLTHQMDFMIVETPVSV